MATENEAVKVVTRKKARMAYSKLTMFLIHPALKNELPHESLANIGDDSAACQAFAATWGSLWEKETASAVGLAGVDLEEVYRLQRDQLRKAWRGDQKEVENLEGQHMPTSFYRWHFKGKRAELIPNDLWSAIVLLFLRDHAAGRTAICANPDCPAPHFIRKRRTQKFCESGPCVEYGARLRANKWWHEHGDQWRKKSKGGK